MPNRIEEILKEIHVLFAKSESYKDNPDMVVVSKQEMFELLEQLNEALYDVMDRYEATQRSRERARIEMDREAAEVKEAAKQASDDIHAASLCYTDTMLGEVKEIVEETRRNVKHQLLELLAELEKQSEQLDFNKDGLKQELSEMHEGNLYVDYIEKLRKKNEEKRTKDKEEKEEDIFAEPEVQKANYVIRVDKPGENAGISISSKWNRNKKPKNGEQGEKVEGAVGADEELQPSGTVFTADDFNLDAEYEQWKENGGDEGEAAAKDKAKEKPKKGGIAAFFGLNK